MAKKLVNALIGVFGGLISTMTGKYIFLFIISLLPILELRGGLIAASLLDMPMWTSLLVCIVSNILIIPFVLFLMESILNLLAKIKFFKRIIDWLKNKTLKKKDLIEKYGYLGIMLFVAALLGVCIAAVIMLIFSYGILKGIVG